MTESNTRENLSALWQAVNVAVADNDELALREAAKLALKQAGDKTATFAEMMYAAGYALYMCRDVERSEECLLSCLARCPGHPGAVLYLAYSRIDRGCYKDAAAILLGLGDVTTFGDVLVADRVEEARVYALCRLKMWRDALTHLSWFQQRFEKDRLVGLTLINLHKLRDELALVGTLDSEQQQIATIVETLVA